MTSNAMSATSPAWENHPWVVAAGSAVRYGIGVTARAPAAQWEEWLRLAQTVDEPGFDSGWVPDHPLVAAGIRYFIGGLSGRGDLATVELLAEKVLPKLQVG